ncbi:MAG: ketosteroid isomerase-like protein [Natronomonas sp.]|jgi:ketosteroid isomerase-like protein|uniref:nuclear transport factor 2 family protein n=1 Tax=Natronomonas sp. TaxID=2184060 RepID=UPI003988F3E5
MDGATLAREYYHAIDDDEYETLFDVLAGGFVHYRPDMTIEGREEFVAFMRTGRPETDTEHAIDAVYVRENGGGDIAVEGRLLRADGETWFGFVDTFTIGENGITELRTYTDDHPT